MGLTQKQELFCREVAAGKSYKDAYIIAYDTKGKDTTVYTESGKLAVREDIQARIKALQKPLETALQVQGLNAKEKQLQEIDIRIEKCKQKEDENNIRMYMDMKNKILGLYKEDDPSKDNDNNLTSLDTTVLQKIANIG